MPGNLWPPAVLSRRQSLSLALGGAAMAAAPRSLCRPALAQGMKPFRIGVVNDQGGPFSALGGPGSVAAARLAVEDVGGTVLGRPIEILVGDHQNKPDLGSGIVREWLDNGVSAVADGASSAVGVAIQTLTRERNKIFLNSGSTTSELTGRLCSRNAVQWILDTYAGPTGAVEAFMSANPTAKKWFTIVVDYTAGHDMERTASDVVRRHGGEVVGTGRFPLGTTDFSSVLLTAQSSGAQAIALGISGADAVNAIKQYREFGMDHSIAMVGMALTINDVETLGHEAASGMVWITNFYFDRDDASREWTRRFRALRNQAPTRMQASTYGAVVHYLRAVAVSGSDDGTTVFAKMVETPATDPLFRGSRVREDGRVLCPLYLMRDKAPSEIRAPSDWAEVVATVAPDQAYRPLSEGGCKLIKA